MAEEIEKIYVIPLKKTKFKSSKAAPTAIKRVKSYLTKHMKVEQDKIWMDGSLNNALWSRGKYNMPSKIRVKAVKFEDGVVEASLPELEFKKSRRELLKEEREKKTPILRRDEDVSEEDDVSGTDDYDIAPTGDGEVKIKKKKPSKKEDETPETKDKPKYKASKKDEKPAKKDSKKTSKKAKKETDDKTASKSKRKTSKSTSKTASKTKPKIKIASKSKAKK